MSGPSVQHRRYRSSTPGRTAAAWGVVVAVHALVGWALVSGTARQQPVTTSTPLQAALIQEVLIPPPPPPAPPPPPPLPPPPPSPSPPSPRRPPAQVTKPARPPPAEAPRVQAPPPPARPAEAKPQESPAAVAAPAGPGTLVTPPGPATPPAVTAPAAAPAPPPPQPQAAAAGRDEMVVACPQQVPPEMPRRALRDGIEGVVKAQALIRDGTVRQVTILSGPRVFHAAVRHAMLQYKCVSGPGEVVATQEFVFRIE